ASKVGGEEVDSTGCWDDERGGAEGGGVRPGDQPRQGGAAVGPIQRQRGRGGGRTAGRGGRYVEEASGCRQGRDRAHAAGDQGRGAAVGLVQPSRGDEVQRPAEWSQGRGRDARRAARQRAGAGGGAVATVQAGLRVRGVSNGEVDLVVER